METEHSPQGAAHPEAAEHHHLPEPLYTRGGLAVYPMAAVAAELHLVRTRLGILAKRGTVRSVSPGNEVFVCLEDVQEYLRTRNPKGGRPRKTPPLCPEQ